MLKSEDNLPETLIRSAAILFGFEEAQPLGSQGISRAIHLTTNTPDPTANLN